MLKLLRFFRPYRLMAVSVLLLVLLQSLADLYLPTLMADIVDKGVVDGDIGLIWRIGGLMLLVAVGGGLFSAAASYFTAKSAGGFARDLRSKVFAHVETFSLKEFDELGTASLINRTTNDINQVYQVVMMMMRVIVMAPIMCLGGLIMAYSLDASLSLVIFSIVPVLALFIFIIFRKGGPLFRSMQQKLDHVSLVLREHLTGIRVIRSFNKGAYEQERFQKANLDLTSTAIKVNRLMAVMMPMMLLIVNLAGVAVIWFGGIRIDHGQMETGELIAFIQYAWQIMFSLVFASMMLVMIPRAAASAARINEVLNMKPSIIETEKAERFNSDASEGLQFDNVTFYYPGAEMPALQCISFTAKPGEVTAVIGGTGSGKSTLLHLISRFYDPSEGTIRLGGVDVKEMVIPALRSQIGLVPQRAMLFSGTIADNIRYGREDASDEEVLRAASTAQADEFIASMKEGIESEITQGGTNLSGGQKQRLSIARALVREANVYLFDDCFSALDYKTDAKLREALKEEVNDAVFIMVAQRISTVIGADRIIVLDEGQICGIGTHRELLETCSVYKEIAASQLPEEEIA